MCVSACCIYMFYTTKNVQKSFFLESIGSTRVSIVAFWKKRFNFVKSLCFKNQNWRWTLHLLLWKSWFISATFFILVEHRSVIFLSVSLSLTHVLSFRHCHTPWNRIFKPEGISGITRCFRFTSITSIYLELSADEFIQVFQLRRT